MNVAARMAGALVTGLGLCVLLGGPTIAWLRRRRLRDDYSGMGALRRAVVASGKEGTPTMGGLLTTACIAMATLLWARLEPLVLGALAVLVASALLGVSDDLGKLRAAGSPSKAKHGLGFRAKLGLTALVGAGAGLWLWLVVWPVEAPARPLAMVLPFGGGASLELAALGLPVLVAIACATLAGTSNAVNLTDGMDGLAPGCVAIAGAVMAVLCGLAGDAALAERLALVHVPGAQEVGVVLCGLVGACLGFLWFNAAPAQVFLGDTGSLSLGALLGYAAVASRTELLLLIVGGVFVVEALSVIIQVAWFKLRGKRVFRCAPIHHHFEKLPMAETKIVARFWIAGLILAVVGLLGGARLSW